MNREATFPNLKIFPLLAGYSSFAPPPRPPDPLCPLLTLLCAPGGYPSQTTSLGILGFVGVQWGPLGANRMACRKLRGGKREWLGYLSPWLLPCQAALAVTAIFPQWLATAPVRGPLPTAKLTRFQEILPFLVALGLRRDNGHSRMLCQVLLISLTPAYICVRGPFISSITPFEGAFSFLPGPD